MRARGLGWLWMVIVVGCIPEAQLQPRPDARALAGDTSAAVAEAAGVRLVADGASWDAHPRNLERRLTPVEIRVENHSGRPLSIRYAHFDLVGGTNFQYAALSPLVLDEASDRQPLCVSGYTPGYWGLHLSWGPSRRWRTYPWAQPWGPGPYYDPFYGPYYDPFYGPPYSTRCEEPLPTQDMLELALPEGTLGNGGTVRGFLYFQGVADRERQVSLQARLVDANTGEPFGELSIPFEVSRD
ncbi:MAG: hypothetical protein JXB05_37945 [Myxococcaceae bacterium]|nr:hypothetical protein [Myxococcaceae bacterium]